MSAVLTPRDEVFPLAQRNAQTLIDPSSSTRFSTDNYTPIESTRRINDMAVSEFILQRQAITRFVRDALQPAVDKRKNTQTSTAEKT